MDEWIVAEYSEEGYGAELTGRIIGAAIEVHRVMGRGVNHRGTESAEGGEEGVGEFWRRGGDRCIV